MFRQFQIDLREFPRDRPAATIFRRSLACGKALTGSVVAFLLVLSAPGVLWGQEETGAVPSPGGVLRQIVENLRTDEFWGNLWFYLLVPALLVVLAILLRRAAARRISNVDELYSARKLIHRITAGVLVVYFGSVLLAGADPAKVATVIGLLGAGLAVALADIIASFVAWFFIIGGRGFKVGDRIRIGAVKGDVVDVGILRSTVMAVRDVGEVEGQATGALRVFPNNLVFRQPLENFTIGNEYVWNEIDYLVTYESDWKKAERITLSAADSIDTERIADEARKKMQLMRRDFRVNVGALTPIVYVKAADSGVLLTLRYLCDVRQVRGTGDRITREVMTRFAEAPDIAFAYPTMRVVPTPPGAKKDVRHVR